jgi:hypothetical protein
MEALLIHFPLLNKAGLWDYRTACLYIVVLPVYTLSYCLFIHYRAACLYIIVLPVYTLPCCLFIHYRAACLYIIVLPAYTLLIVQQDG